MLLLVFTAWGGVRTAKWYSRLTDTRVILFLALLMVSWWILRNTPQWHQWMA